MKSCKGVTKNLSDMAKELEHIGSITSVGELPQKMEEAEEAKNEVEAIILKRVSPEHSAINGIRNNYTISARFITRNFGRMGAV